jgi:hypothetical protein
MRKRLLRLLFLLVAGSALSPTVTGQQIRTAADLQSVAGPKWREYIGFARRLVLDVTSQETDVTEGAKPLFQDRASYRQSQNGSLAYVMEVTVPHKTARAWVCNQRYAFELTKTRKSEWALVNLDVKLADGIGIPYLKSIIDDKEFCVRPPLSVYSLFLPSAVGSGELIVKHVELLRGGMVKIHFLNTPGQEATKRASYYVVSGVMTLVPAEFWRVEDYEATVKWLGGETSFVTGKNDCWKGKEGYPILRRSVSRERVTVRAKELVRERENVVTAEERLPNEDEFTLTAFGLPEPMGEPPVVRATTRWYLWILLAAMACAVAAWYCYRRNRVAASTKRAEGTVG